jgi:hypothetical protein
VTKRLTNQRMAELGQSEIRAMTQACIAAGGLNMAQGVCDTPVPPVVLKSAAEARGSMDYRNYGKPLPSSWTETTGYGQIRKQTSQ